MRKLLAIDGLNIVRRVYEANDEADSAEKAERALRNSLSSFRRLLDTHQPTHVLAAFDFGGPTWRHALYEKYRAERKEMPAVLKECLPDFFSKLAGLGLTVVSIPDVEADDVIATGVIRWLREERGEAIVVSSDKDLHGLIAEGAMVWDHFKSEWHDRAWVEEKFGVPPEKMTDLLALMGDASDGIPGVSNVGIKTAAKLLQSYGDLERVMTGAGILLTPIGAKLRKDRDLALLSRKLAELKTDVRLGVTWKMLEYHRSSSSG